jgi:hypothetical protein
MTPSTVTPARVAELATALTIAAEEMARLQSEIVAGKVTTRDASDAVNETITNLIYTAQ